MQLDPWERWQSKRLAQPLAALSRPLPTADRANNQPQTIPPTRFVLDRLLRLRRARGVLNGPVETLNEGVSEPMLLRWVARGQ